MKLRALRLTNVRRFAGQTARIEGLGDGLSVIAAPNEYGKTTFFDALHALFFFAHGSKGKEVRSLQPDPGGGPAEVAAEIDLPEGRFRIEKRFLGRTMARVTETASGRIVAQADEAEAWIAGLMGQGVQGPAGLLWVRQGVSGLDEKASDQLAARRDLLSMVAGEIDLVTGGRRMDRVMSACQQELDRHLTAADRPRAGGPLREARDEAERCAAEVADLAARASALERSLSELSDARRRLAAVMRPENEAGLRTADQAAQAALRAAEDRAAQAEAAGQQARLRALELAQAKAALADLRLALGQVEAAARAAAEAGTQADALTAAACAAEAEEAAATESLAVAEARVASAATELRDARRAQEARTARAALERLEARLTQAETRQAAIEAAEAELAGLAVTPATLTRLEAALVAEAEARARHEARALRLGLTYEGDARILRDGEPLPEGVTVLEGRAVLDLPGIGRMVVDPGRAEEDTARKALARAGAETAAALAACAEPTPDAARAAMAKRTEAEAALRLAKAMFETLAPAGLAPLRAEVARLRGLAGEVDDEVAGPAAVEVLEQAHADAATAERAARPRAEQAARATRDARVAAAVAAEQARAALATRNRAEAAAGPPEARGPRLLAAERAVEAAAAAEAAARLRAEALAGEVADLETLRAESARTASAREAAQAEAARLRETIARLEGEIRAQADLGLTEALAEAEGRLLAAEVRAARLGAEVAALMRLRAVLQETRLAAREAYFGPVQQELAPLLAILQAEAAVDFDADTLLPGQLRRGGAEESLGRLSGGTQEQIAVLTRLAFARLFARTGRPVPVILDDALVHSDDDRIVRMFTALHRVAAGQQVIVLTCRQMAFAALGGARPVVSIVAADADGG